jgi:antitoxin YefM
MAATTTYASLRENLASVRRRGAEDVALVPAAELAGLMKTAQLLRSRRNARRLLIALRRAQLRGRRLGDPPQV